MMRDYKFTLNFENILIIYLLRLYEFKASWSG